MMGKINNNSGIEIIPLDDTNSGNNQGNSTVPRPDMDPLQQRAKMQRLPYIADPTLVPRVQKYLETNVDKTYVNINLMADDLQRQYRDYGKRKRSAFRASVKKAYSIVLHSYGIQDRDPSSSEDLSEDSVVDEDGEFPENSLNNQLMDLYGRPPPPKQNKVEENELIDISSDDSNDEQFPNDKAKNGPSTSKKNENNQSPVPYYSENVDKILPFTNDKIPYKLAPNTTVPTDRGKKRKFESTYATITSFSKKKKSLAALQEPNVTFKDVGGMNHVLEDVCKLLVHVKHPEIYRQIGISPPRGFLLHGPPGCGKTLLASAIAGELNVPLLKVAAPELVAGVSGESEERIRELFERATSTSPCVLFIDEIDAITPNRQNAQKEMERRIVAQILTCLDDLSQNESADRVLVIGATNRPDSIDPALRRAGRFDREVCLGIPDVQSREHILKVLTSKLKLVENFDYMSLAKFTPGFVGADLMALTREAAMVAVNRVFNELKGKPRLEKEARIRKPSLPTSPDVSNKQPESTSANNKPEPDIVVDDTDDLTKKSKQESTVQNEPVVVIDDEVKQTVPGKNDSVILDVTEQFEKPPLSPLEELLTWLHEEAPLTKEQLNGLFITVEDFGKALKCVQPSAKREGFATVPDVTWDNVGSLRDIREELQMAILAPVRHAEQFKALGMSTPTGVLLCGPPGCGKTLLAKAIANEAGINFISVKGPELLNMYVGESERAVRVCFTRARNSAPCVIFFDEIDALCPKRSDTREGGVTMRVVNQMLTEMDGMDARRDVYLLAASNRPDIVDPAVLRPGRLDKILYVGLPTAADRVDILRAVTKNGTKPTLAPDVDLEVIGKSEKCDGYTGADLAALVREASVVALKEFMMCGNPQQPLMVTTEHFKTAVNKIRPSVTEKDQKYYEKIRKVYASTLENDVEEMEYS